MGSGLSTRKFVAQPEEQTRDESNTGRDPYSILPHIFSKMANTFRGPLAILEYDQTMRRQRHNILPEEPELVP